MTMTMTRTSRFLRLALLADAIASGATALQMTLLSGTLAALLNLPQDLLLGAGVILLPYAAFVGYLSRRETLPRWVVFAVIVCNVLWAADSLLLAFSSWITPTALGYAFIICQALIVAVFAELQYIGLRKSTAPIGRTAAA
jgi:hypothetical protein